MALKEKLIKNILSNWANVAINLVISFLLAPYVVHQLGNTYYGIWVIMMQFTGYLYLLDFGVRESIIRYVSKYGSTGDARELNEVLTSGVLFYSGIGLVCVLITLVLAYFFTDVFNVEQATESTAHIVVIISGLTIAQMLAFNVFGGILMGLQRYDIFNKIGIAFAFVRVALIVFFLSRGYGIIALAFIQLFIGVATNFFIFLAATRLLKQTGIPFKYLHRPFREHIPTFKELYNYSIYVLINNLGQKAIFYTDALIIGIFMSAASVTFYAIAGNLIEYLRRFIVISTEVLNPLVSELESRQDNAAISAILLQGSKLSTLMALPLGVVYMIMGREFISLWMGPEYQQLSGDVLFVLALTTLMSIPQNTISSVLYGISRHKIIANLRLVEAALNLGLSLLLVQQLGIVGVALGTAIPQILLMSIVLPILVSRVVAFPALGFVTSVYIRPLFAALPFGAALVALYQWLPTQSLAVFFLQIILALPIYFGSAWYICFSRAERERYSRAVRNRLGRRRLAH